MIEDDLALEVAADDRQDLSLLVKLSGILLGATIITTVLLSGMEGGNEINFAVTAVFAAVATGTAILEKQPFRFFPEIVILLVWLAYAIIPSMFGIALDPAYVRVQQMLQIAVLVLLAMNVMVWTGATQVYFLLFFLSGVAVYVSSIAGIGFGLIDAELLRDMNSADRVVGTHENANKFGRAMVLSQVAALLFAVSTKNLYLRLAAILAFVVLGVAVLHSGSRTALVGMLVIVAGMPWIFRLWTVKSAIYAVIVAAFLVAASVGAFYVLKDNEAVMSRVESYLQNEDLQGRYENLFRLVTSFGNVDQLDHTAEGSVSTRAQLAVWAWETAVEYPFGVGLDNFAAHYEFGGYAHSNYFEILATTGFVGLALFLTIYGRMLHQAGAFCTEHSPRGMMSKAIVMGILAQVVMDIANVSYFSKPYWLCMSLLIVATYFLRYAPNQHGDPTASLKFGVGLPGKYT